MQNIEENKSSSFPRIPTAEEVGEDQEKSTHDKLSAAGKKGAAARWGTQEVKFTLIQNVDCFSSMSLYYFNQLFSANQQEEDPPFSPSDVVEEEEGDLEGEDEETESFPRIPTASEVEEEDKLTHEELSAAKKKRAPRSKATKSGNQQVSF